MVLADTSVWIQHFRQRDSKLIEFLTDGLILMHPFVSGELICGNLRSRDATLLYLRALPSATAATDSEVVRMVQDRHLWGKGLGWIDMHLLASALLSHSAFWTLDKKLHEAAKEIGLPQ